MKSLESRCVCRRLDAAKYIRRLCQQLLFPLGDLSGMDAELLGQFGERLVAFDSRQGDLALKVAP